MPAAGHDLCRAAQGHAQADRVRRQRGDRRPLGQGHQGAGRLYGRHAAHDVERHLRHQRHRARDRLADAPLARRVLRPRPRQDPFLGQAAVRRAHHSLSRLVARFRVRRQGHRLCAHRPAPQAAGDDAALCARARGRGDSLHLLRPHRAEGDQGGLAHAVPVRPPARHQADQRSDRRQDRQGRDRGRPQGHGASRQEARRRGPEGASGERRGPARPLPRPGHHQHGDGRDLWRGGRGARRQAARHAEGARSQGDPDPRHRSRQYRRVHPQHARRRQELQSRGGAARHLPGDAAGRAADAGSRGDAVQRHLLRFGALRPLRRRPRQDEHASRPRCARHGAHVAQGGHPRRDQDAGRSARRQGRDRRHRPSRQSPGALGRRADGESVSRRPACAWSAPSRSA